jgi:hypothetical protein
VLLLAAFVCQKRFCCRHFFLRSTPFPSIHSSLALPLAWMTNWPFGIRTIGRPSQRKTLSQTYTLLIPMWFVSHNSRCKKTGVVLFMTKSI